MNWTSYRLCVLERNRKPLIVLAKGRQGEDGKFKIESNTDDRTDSVLLTVMSFFKRKMISENSDKVFCGVGGPFGKLVYIKPGYTFHIIKEVKRE